MTSLNELAWDVVEKTIARAEALGIMLIQRPGGTRILDAGVAAAGGLEAGLAMAHIAMSGMGWASLELAVANGVPWPWVTVHSDRTLEACFLSQSAHWPVAIGSFRAMGSGPACLLNRSLNISHLDRQETSDRAVLVLETAYLPDEATCQEIARQCGVNPADLALIVAPTSSLAGSAQIAARSVETGLHKLHHLGFDLRKVASGMGRCPAAAPTDSDRTSLGKTNDMVMFASQVWLSVRAVPDSELADWAQRIPASTSSSYGEPFLKTLNKAGGFYGVDPGLFAPAEVTFTSLDSGMVFHAGSIDQVRLAQALGV